MRPSHLPPSLLATAASSLVSTTLALHVAPGSSCTSACLAPESSSTTTISQAEIVCDETEYFTTSVGKKYKRCIDCLENSPFVNESQSDTAAFINNLRYASAVCLYDYPVHNTNNTLDSTECNNPSACLPLQITLETGLNQTSSSEAWGYCTADDSALYQPSVHNCVSCLQSASSYTGNFITALQEGCTQHPISGIPLQIPGELFSTNPLNKTLATTTSTTNPSSSSGLTQGAIIGISLAIAALLLLAMVLFHLHWRRQRRWEDDQDPNPAGAGDYYAYYPSKHPYSGGGGGGHASYTLDHKSAPASTGSTKTWSPAHPEATYQQEGDFASNAEYYDQLETRHRAVSPPSAAIVDVAALPAHPAYIPRELLTSSRASRRSATPSLASSLPPRRTLSPAWGSPPPPPPPPKDKGPDPYTIQVYLNSLEDAQNPGTRTSTSSRSTHDDGISRDIGITHNTSLSAEAAAAPVRTSSSASNRPVYGASRGATAPETVAPRSSLARTMTLDIPSLILPLPSVPRIRIPGKKPTRLRVSEREAPRVTDDLGISGPLDFPSSRFVVPPGDRIVEQTADRTGYFMEVPIRSGKSALYG